MPRTTFLAPTDKAFKSMDLESVQNLLAVNSNVDHNELIRKFFKLHKLKKEYVHRRHKRLQPHFLSNVTRKVMCDDDSLNGTGVTMTHGAGQVYQ